MSPHLGRSLALPDLAMAIGDPSSESIRRLLRDVCTLPLHYMFHSISVLFEREREREREKERGSRGEERASAAVASLHRAQLRLRNITAPVRPSAMASYIRVRTPHSPLE